MDNDNFFNIDNNLVTIIFVIGNDNNFGSINNNVIDNHDGSRNQQQ